MKKTIKKLKAQLADLNSPFVAGYMALAFSVGWASLSGLSHLLGR